MAIKINRKIINFSVQPTKESVREDSPPPKGDVIQMHEKLERPEMLLGSTYKIKTPLSEHALYVTINDIVLNTKTEHEQRRPFEIFINSKNMEHFQWIVALTLIISAVFRKGGDVTFLVEELRSVFDPRGGYFKKGGKYMPSLVAEIGDAIESHLLRIGLLRERELEPEQQKLITQKHHEYIRRTTKQPSPTDTDAPGAAPTESPNLFENTQNDISYPHGAMLCTKCHTQAVIMMDGCMTCLSCGDSKCG